MPLSGRLTRGQILDAAQRRAGNTSTSLKAEMRVWLNRLLEDLYTEWDWPFLLTTTTVRLQPIFPLPADFLRPADVLALLVVRADGQPFRQAVRIVDPTRFLYLSATSAESRAPTIWTIDYAAQVGKVWPTPLAACDALLHYKRLPPDVDPTNPAAYDADIPLFPWSSHLVDAMTVKVLEWDENPRAETELLKLDERFQRLRASALPPESVTIPDLDPETFGPPFTPEC